MNEPKVLTGDTGIDIYTRTRELYLAAMKDDPTFQWDFREGVFGRHFSRAAHEHEIRYHDGVLAIDLTPEQREDRRQYNMYYGTAKLKLIRFLENKKKASEKAASGNIQKKKPDEAPSSETAHVPNKPRLFPGPSNAQERARAAQAQIARLAGDHPSPQQLTLPGFIPEGVTRFLRDLHARLDKKPQK